MPAIFLPTPAAAAPPPGTYFRWPAKAPPDVDTYTLDFSGPAGAYNDTLASCVLTLSPAYISGGLQALSPIIVNGGAAQVTLGAGNVGQDYGLQFQGTTTGGRVITVQTMLYVPLPVQPSAAVPPPAGYGALTNTQVLTELAANLPQAPVGLTVGQWYFTGGGFFQVPASWPTAPDGLQPGAYWLNAGVVNQVPTSPPSITPPGFGVLGGETILSNLVAGFQTTPVGLTAGRWYLSGGFPAQVPSTWPSGASGVPPGGYYFDTQGVVQQVPSP